MSERAAEGIELLRKLGLLKYIIPELEEGYGVGQNKHHIYECYEHYLRSLDYAAKRNFNKYVRLAALLHDIGKAVDQHYEGTHAIIGAELANRYGESKLVGNAIAAHHEEVEPESIVAVIVQAADAISGSRPGARREILEAYIKRLEKLEEIATSFSGVGKAYAIQAGREIRIAVEPDKISDAQAEELAWEIARRIEAEMKYPGQIKVTVVREKRAVDYAR